MSCIATLRQNNIIYMACDSAWTFAEGAISTATEPKKIITLPIKDSEEQVLVGVCGDGGILCELYNGLDDLLDEPTVFSEIRGKIDKILREDKVLWDIFEAKHPTTVLVAIGSELYRIESRYSWIEVEGDIYAIGSGADLALGALAALSVTTSIKDIWPDTPTAWLITAMETAAMYDTSVQQPFHLISTVKIGDEEK